MRVLFKETRYVLNCLREMFNGDGRQNYENLDYDVFYDHVQDTYIRDRFKWNLEDWVRDLKTYNSKANDN